ncbi:MAG: hypothetical protein M3Y49_04890 [Actinomycetota bacterium]|nr:hypothetical protein [Actinomycetota bacterium]
MPDEGVTRRLVGGNHIQVQQAKLLTGEAHREFCSLLISSDTEDPGTFPGYFPALHIGALEHHGARSARVQKCPNRVPVDLQFHEGRS